MFSWSKAECIVLPTALICIIVVSALVCFLTRKQSETIKKIPLMIISATILILEIVKQTKNIIEGYSLWAIPLHFCSLFLYFFPLASFFKGKVGEFGKTMSLICSTFFIALFYFYPSSVIGDSCSNVFQSFGTFHTWIYHHLIILFFFIFVGSNIYKPKKVEFLYAMIGISLYATIGITSAHALKVNFCNLLYSNIPFMENLRVNTGQALYTFIMILIGLCGALIIVSLAYIIERVRENHKLKKEDSFYLIMKTINKTDGKFIK